MIQINLLFFKILPTQLKPQDYNQIGRGSSDWEGGIRGSERERVCVSMAEKRGGDEKEEDGVLLYYRYVTIPDVSSMALFFHANCESLGLLGRVRISSSGVNVTVRSPLYISLPSFCFSVFSSLVHFFMLLLMRRMGA